MIDLTNAEEIRALKQAFEYSFTGPTGEKTMEFIEEFGMFWKGGPADAEGLSNNVLQHERGRRDFPLTIKTIMNPAWTPEKIAEIYQRQENK